MKEVNTTTAGPDALKPYIIGSSSHTTPQLDPLHD